TAFSPRAMLIWDGSTKRARSLRGCAALRLAWCRAPHSCGALRTASCLCRASARRWANRADYGLRSNSGWLRFEPAERPKWPCRAELRAHGRGGEWQLLSPGETAVFIDLAKVFDLTILGQLSPEIRSTGFRPDEIVIATGRPVLVVPYAGTFDTVGRRVLVAWDGTREAARA